MNKMYFRDKKKYKKRILGLLYFLLILVSVFWFGKISLDNRQNYTGELEFHIIDVGQGSSAFIECDNKFALIDGGDKGSGSKVVEYLKAQGVEKLDYLIVTHYDIDHIYGLMSVVYNFNIGEILAPDYEADTKIYKSFINVIKLRKIKKRQPELNEEIRLGGATLTCVCPVAKEYQNENDYSLGFKVSYKNRSVLICGDATYRSEIDMVDNEVDIDSDVLIVSHHGSSSSSTSEFLEKVSPQKAIISCGIDNDYGHPTKKVLKRLDACGAQIYRTDLSGDIIVKTDGSDISVSCTQED